MLKVELAVLGPFRALVDGDDVTARLTAAQRSLLGVLAAAREPVAKDELRRLAGLARTSIDPQLSRLHTTLRTAKPVHLGGSGGVPRGFVTLDPAIVATDVDAFMAGVEAGARARADDEAVALTLLLCADDLWRGPVLDGVTVVADTGPVAASWSVGGPVAEGAPGPLEAIVDRLLAERRRCRELAARCWLAGVRDGLDADRLERWADELGDSALCWFAATTAAVDRDGQHAGAVLMARWRERGSIDDDAAGSGLFATARRLVDAPWTDPTSGVALGADAAAARATTGGEVHLPERVAELLRHADVSHIAGDWDEAERRYAVAADEARAGGDVVVEAEVLLAMARITWDPARFGGQLEERLTAVLDQLPPSERLLRARLLACIAGGLYQDGSIDVDRAEAPARQALELVGELEDPLTAAEVLSRARKALLDVDPPAVQLERSRRILALAGRSDHHRSIGLLDAIVDLLMLDRLAEARAECERYREIAGRTRSALHRYHVASHDGMWALVDGRYDDVAAATARAERYGSRFGGITVAQVVGAQRLWAAYEQGDEAALREMLPFVDLGAQLTPDVQVWEVTGALVAATLGDVDDAVARLDRTAAVTDDLRRLPRGPLRIATLALAARAYAAVAAAGGPVRPEVARALTTELEDHPAPGVLVGWPALYLGPTRDHIALVAPLADG